MKGIDKLQPMWLKLIVTYMKDLITFNISVPAYVALFKSCRHEL